MPKNITINKILNVLLARLKFIILAGVALGLLFFLYSSFIITPMYSTSTMIYVQNYNKTDLTDDTQQTTDPSSPSAYNNSNLSDSNNDRAGKIFGSDISGSNSLASICVTLFENSDEVTSLYDGCYVSIHVTEGTFYITISVDGPDPKKCANVANQVADTCTTVFHSRFQYGQIGTIRLAKVPSAPYSPDKFKNTLIGFILGLVVAAVISILLELIDTTIKTDDDIQDLYGIPVFAEIPDYQS